MYDIGEVIQDEIGYNMPYETFYGGFKDKR